MTGPPDVSIVVCTYNRAPSLRLTLDALGAQQTPPELAWELVVVNNNSTDATPAVVAAFAAGASIPVRSVFVAQQGLSFARNAGLAQCRGAIVGFTDDDVQPAPDWVARIATVFDERKADIVGGRILPLWQRPPPPQLEEAPFFHGAVAIMTHPTPADIVDAYASPTVWGANMAFRRSLFDQVGRFDTRLGVIRRKLYRGEETNLVARAIAAGYRAVYDPRVLVWHRIGADRIGIRYLSRLHFQRAEGEALVHDGRPRYRFRSIPQRAWWWLAALLRARPNTLERWLDGCAAAGFMWGVTKRRLRKPPGPR